jgi:hypothetical protein
MRRIGGSLDLDALAALHGRNRHRPYRRENLRAAAIELRHRGLLPLDIARALELTELAVRQLLGEVTP